MPLGKQIKLLKTATEKAVADQLNAAGYAFLQEQSELAGYIVYSRVTLASNSRC